MFGSQFSWIASLNSINAYSYIFTLPGDITFFGFLIYLTLFGFESKKKKKKKTTKIKKNKKNKLKNYERFRYNLIESRCGPRERYQIDANSEY